MIKCNVTVCGTISRAAQIRTGKDGNYTSFGVSVILMDKSGNSKTIEVGISKEGNEDLSSLGVGTRVEVAGILTFRKQDDKLWFNLNATGINNFAPGDKDAISGDMEFRGTLGKKPVDTKNDKKGKPFKLFSAYSSQRTMGEGNEPQYAFTWVHFVQFDAQDSDWLQPSMPVDIKGDLDVSVFNDKVNLGCRVKELAKWDKQNTNQQ